MEPEAEKRLKGLLLELARFDLAGGPPCKMEEYEGAVLTFQSASGESASTATKVGMVLARLGVSELASHFAMNAEVKEWHAFNN